MEDLLLHGVKPSANLLDKLTGQQNPQEALCRGLWEVLTAITHRDKILGSVNPSTTEVRRFC